ncbi:ABC transporter permease [Herbiconiux flava]|uniref:NitT/TauT family transport system permease protein n=1 Tax=Herbiconiux flava TaxID=881268 RepID=A0A852STA5_9MICO|nr:ABC transporter permease subunit [Herbiconiux flava]NYD71973.1 NitT/TauT family transport system permease protein [Herbiconiux flava]GLK18064.1 ABC transporter permease [Herbiconiux flava]
MRASAGTLRTVLAPVILGVVALALWQLLVVAFDIKPFIVPGPLAIGTEFGDNIASVVAGALVTGGNALVGLVIGGVVGILFAVLAALARVVDELTAGIVAALAVVPIVALAPVLYTMFGAGAETARQLVAALAVFIPVYINTLRGLRQVRPVHRDLMHVYAASAWQTTRTVTVPGALPFIFTGLRIASSLAVISALIAEYFGGPVGGLGKSITSAASSSNYNLAWAYVLGAIIVGLVFYCVTLAIETFATRNYKPRT